VGPVHARLDVDRVGAVDRQRRPIGPLPAVRHHPSPIQQVGTSIWWDASTGIFTRGSCIGEAGGTYLYTLLADAVTPSDSSGLANGDVIIHGGTYEVAA
jgi:hypothetical protein